MGTPFPTEQTATIAKLESANFFDLGHNTSTISYTASNIAGDPIVTYNNGSVTRSFIGKEVRRDKTELGTLVTVTLELIPDGSKHLLTLVLPEVLVKNPNGPRPEKVSVPVVFHTVQAGIAGPRPHPGTVQTYDVQIFTGTAEFVIS